MYLITCTVTVAAGAVFTLGGIPQQEQAEEYAAALEQALAYVGTAVGETVTWRLWRVGGRGLNTVEV